MVTITSRNSNIAAEGVYGDLNVNIRANANVTEDNAIKDCSGSIYKIAGTPKIEETAMSENYVGSFSYGTQISINVNNNTDLDILSTLSHAVGLFINDLKAELIK